MNKNRYMAQIDAKFLSRHHEIPFLTEHVTSAGVFVRTDNPPQAMELLRIEFTLPPYGKKIVLHGMVTRMIRQAGSSSPPGVDISFFAKDGDSGLAWDAFIKFLRDEHPESASRSIALAYSGKDQVRRAHPRVTPQSTVRLQAKEASAERAFDVGNISAGGMFIRTDDAFLVGAELRVTLENPRTRAMTSVECIVRRRIFGTNAGVGVEFRNVNDAQRFFIRELMESAGGPEVAAHCEEVSIPTAYPGLTPRLGAGRGTLAAVEASWAPAGDGWRRQK